MQTHIRYGRYDYMVGKKETQDRAREREREMDKQRTEIENERTSRRRIMRKREELAEKANECLTPENSWPVI